MTKQTSKVSLPVRLLAKAFGVACAEAGDQRSARLSPFRRLAVSPFRSRNGFTLLELIIVLGIIGLLLILLAPAFTYLKSGGDFASAVYGIQGFLENARTYAKANHTYVFVGFAEVDASVGSSLSPQQVGNGRVAVAAVASKDGTRHFAYTTDGTQGNDWTANYSSGANLVAIGKLQTYQNLHFLVDFGPWQPTGVNSHPTSIMARFRPSPVPPYILGGDWSSINNTSATPFSWPLGSALNSGQYNFTRVVYFDPKGVARIADSTNADEITQVIEIDLQPTHVTLVPPNPTSTQDVGNQAAIQLYPMTGEVRVYRP